MRRFVVSQILNAWVVRDTEQMKKRKRSIVYEAKTKEDAEGVCKLCNERQSPPPSNYHPVSNRG